MIMMCEELYCSYGFSECHDPTTRDLSSCLGCWVLAPPDCLQKENIDWLKHKLAGNPHHLDFDTVYFDMDHLPSTNFVFQIMLHGFKVVVPKFRVVDNDAKVICPNCGYDKFVVVNKL